MTKTTKIDWTGHAAIVAGAFGAAIGYLVALAVLFGPLAHEVVRMA